MYSRSLKVICGISAGVASVVYVQKVRSAEKTNNFTGFIPETSNESWTSNYVPSVKWDYNWDRRLPKSVVKPPSKKKDANVDDEVYQQKLAEAKPTATRHLILIRHGQYNMDAEDDKNRTLTLKGREQANMTGLRLKDMNLPINVIHNSTMTRAIETADIITKHFPDVPRTSCDLLREGAPIPPEPAVLHWKPEATFLQDGARIEAAFYKYFYRASADQTTDSVDVLVCHANVIRYVVCRALQLPPEAWLRFSLNHGSISWVCIRPSGRVSVRMLGNSGFMPYDMVSVT
ncbi:serine/threonine-protein phosphatase PGAM5, mitochondrial-like isoform X2 [Anneissia japonica]|uniref:serine/threonine-protein phosphatase PGAM5, mitochondrial-like isoform X2 n=1 Tax=Anneissia japonica TaxID=1529436 RepID=UPI001425A0D2|nr:serine/threonine-protein phosphatase PGAM5, mitochondrial-like isoform X2 [Anneissia japonica]